MSEVPLYAEAEKARDAVKIAHIGCLNTCVHTKFYRVENFDKIRGLNENCYTPGSYKSL